MTIGDWLDDHTKSAGFDGSREFDDEQKAERECSF
jgi:hypothetical protein